jgi:REP element-mobilizing transposase RayT
VCPVRKQNRLAGFSYSQPGAYFITVCTKERRCFLSTIVGADAHIGPHPALTAAGAVVEKYIKSIPGIGEYVIMPNHVHMILRISATDVLQGPMWASAPTNASVPNLIRSFKTLTSKDLGESIWQRSYYDHVIRDEADYLVRVRYIEENPSKWLYDDYYIP